MMIFESLLTTFSASITFEAPVIVMDSVSSLQPNHHISVQNPDMHSM